MAVSNESSMGLTTAGRKRPKPAMRQEAATTGSCTTKTLSFPIAPIAPRRRSNHARFPSSSPRTPQNLAPGPLLPSALPHYPQIHRLRPRSTHAPPGATPAAAAAARRGSGGGGGGSGDAVGEDGAPAVRRGSARGGRAWGAALAPSRERGLLPRAGAERPPAAEAAGRRQVPAPLPLPGRQYLPLRQRLGLVILHLGGRWDAKYFLPGRIGYWK